MLVGAIPGAGSRAVGAMGLRSVVLERMAVLSYSVLYQVSFGSLRFP